MVQPMVDWLFRSRQTGRITVAQAPNAPLVIFLAAAVARWIFHPSGTWGTIVDVVAAGSLAYWAGDEVLRGVNPWRRGLGAGVLAYLVIEIL
jgi:hypothetical protein